MLKSMKNYDAYHLPDRCSPRAAGIVTNGSLVFTDKYTLERYKLSFLQLSFRCHHLCMILFQYIVLTLQTPLAYWQFVYKCFITIEFTTRAVEATTTSATKANTRTISVAGSSSSFPPSILHHIEKDNELMMKAATYTKVWHSHSQGRRSINSHRIHSSNFALARRDYIKLWPLCMEVMAIRISFLIE
jgi:hypothetical protein